MARAGERDDDAPAPDNGAKRGALLSEFRADPRELLMLSRVRMVAGVLALLAASAALLGSLPVPALLVALLGLAMSLAWIRQARRAARSAHTEPAPALRLHERGIELAEGERTHWVPWSNVASIAVDEERLDIVVQRSGQEPLRIEPRYPGVDIYQLVRTLDDAWSAARRDGGADCSQRT